MKYLFFLTLLTISLNGFSADITGPLLANPSSCTIRASNDSLKRNPTGTSSQQYCSGTMINPTTVVTAAHCLNEVTSSPISNAINVVKPFQFNISFNNSESEQIAHLSSGESAVYTSDMMTTAKQRESYIANGDMKLTNQDLAVIRLTTPIDDSVGKSCPRLPTNDDCQKFSNLINSGNIDTKSLYSYFYRSKYFTSGAGVNLKNTPFPSNDLIKLEAVKAPFLSKNGFLAIAFEVTPKNIKLLKGDSGTTLIWNNNGEEIIMGVQSGAESKAALPQKKDTPLSPLRAIFAQACSHISQTRWAQVTSPSVTQQATKKSSTTDVGAGQ